ncbi:hypothetical protein [Flavobacterium sp.]|uniref:hypothetical protein n=1 Tax=Flavobacterium sp. TaxID=239 RepID=UPI002628E797|nr:hypothetical protein [Flavobacterium sp.]MDG2431044.1 hypothetical protein [Flavobacterium sp.]
MQKILLLLSILCLSGSTYAQQQESKTSDDTLKEQIYNVNKKVVVNYSMKDFEMLFLEFLNIKGDPSIHLTKEEFYNYTIKIAAFSDRLAKLYPKEKAVAEESKKKWFAESYEEYLLSKASPKK